ncbi:hypothetical protein GHT09_011650 [Marmota monax]|uniref:Uncharacterized protein n=1 Tax=Marmota monax TaxID=9995 RepID=A0A834PMK9_MARMO|nr:hypothetical protein GHT09_011650 [Marmota monax]
MLIFIVIKRLLVKPHPTRSSNALIQRAHPTRSSNALIQRAHRGPRQAAPVDAPRWPPALCSLWAPASPASHALPNPATPPAEAFSSARSTC